MSVSAAKLPGGNVLRNANTAFPRCFHTGGVAPAATADGNDTTPATTETYLAEVYVPGNVFVTGIGLFNGSANGGNVVLGLYDVNGNLLGSTAATAQSGTDAFQKVPLSAPIELQPGNYFVAAMFSSTSARFNSHVLGVFGAGKLTGQTAVTLPATATMPVTFTTALGPMATLY